MVQNFGSCTMLAGGASSRMGRDKELILENTASILHVLEPLFSQILVSTRNPALYAGKKLLPINDIIADCGPLGGIFSALCLSSSQYLFVIPCDMPNINQQLILQMQQKTAEELPDICIFASERGLEPLVGFYSKALLEEMRDFLLSGGRKMQTFLENKNCLIIEAAEIEQVRAQTFANINSEKVGDIASSELIEKLPAKRYNKQGSSGIEENVAKEISLKVFCNEDFCFEISCSPSALEEMVIGRLYSSGLLHNMTELRQLSIAGPAAFAEIEAKDIKLPEVAERKFDAARLTALSAEFLSHSQVFEKTGGVHSAAVSDGVKLLCFFEDIGRFNAVDKCIGFCLQNGIDMRQNALYTSGRIAAQMAEKTISAGFPLLVSRAAPTDKAIVLAQEKGLSLIAFARNGRFNMYCGYERVVF